MNKRILIADDERAQLRIFQLLLTSNMALDACRAFDDNRSYEPHFFDDGKPLLDFFKNEFKCGRRIPLCLLDMRMINMDGIETAEALRAVDPEVFIMIITAYDDISHNSLINILKKDIYFMNKPIRPREFMALISSLLINWNNQQAIQVAYRELNYANRRLQMLIENTPIAVAMFDKQMRYLSYSRRWVSDLGIKENNLIGHSHYDVVRDIPEHWKEEHQRCLNGETICHREEKFVRTDDSVEFVSRELYPFKDSLGNIEGIIIFIKFNTEKILAQQARKEAEEKVKENEEYLKAIMSAIQTSVIITDPEKYTIVDANPYTLKMFDCTREDIIGRDLYEFRADDAASDPSLRIVSNEYALKTQKDEIIHVRRSVKKTTANKKLYLVQSLLDITDIRNFMKKQEISIELAKYLLQKINGHPPSQTSLPNGLSLCFNAIYLPCFKEGGDHYFVRALEQNGRTKTFVSLKDQSGHDVGCILRSIITDLTHHSILNKHSDISVKEVVTILNREIYCAGVFKDQDFFTSVDIAIDHQTLEMEYISAGHPRFFLIRDKQIFGLPEHDRVGRNLPIPVLPDMRYSSAFYRLKAGDKLILYSDGLNDLPMMKKGDSIPYMTLKSLLQDIVYQHPLMSISDLIQVLFDDVSRKSQADSDFVTQGSLPDDITIIGLEIEDETLWNEKIIVPDSLTEVNQSISDLYLEFQDELKRRNFNISDIGIRSELSESVVNAWIHGNHRDKDKTITIRWRYGNVFQLSVEDNGEGFDSHRVLDPKSEENIIKTSGRGIYIIRRFSDAVRWEKDGRCIIITIKTCRDKAEQIQKQKKFNQTKILKIDA